MKWLQPCVATTKQGEFKRLHYCRNGIAARNAKFHNLKNKKKFQESERKAKEKELEEELLKKREAERKQKEEQQKMLEAELAKERERIRQLQQEQLKQKFDYEKLDFEGDDNKSPSPPPASGMKSFY